jgi:hypothetical protein
VLRLAKALPTTSATGRQVRDAKVTHPSFLRCFDEPASTVTVGGFAVNAKLRGVRLPFCYDGGPSNTNSYRCARLAVKLLNTDVARPSRLYELTEFISGQGTPFSMHIDFRIQGIKGCNWISRQPFCLYAPDAEHDKGLQIVIVGSVTEVRFLLKALQSSQNGFRANVCQARNRLDVYNLLNPVQHETDVLVSIVTDTRPKCLKVNLNG